MASEKLMDRYKSEGKPSIYYLMPKTTKIYFLDFRQKRFQEENLAVSDIRTSKEVNVKTQYKIPELGTSTQLADG